MASHGDTRPLELLARAGVAARRPRIRAPRATRPRARCAPGLWPGSRRRPRRRTRPGSPRRSSRLSTARLVAGRRRRSIGELDLKRAGRRPRRQVGPTLAEPGGRRARDGRRGRRDQPAGRSRRRCRSSSTTRSSTDPTVLVSAGRRGRQVELAPADLVHLTEATVAPIARTGPDLTHVTETGVASGWHTRAGPQAEPTRQTGNNRRTPPPTAGSCRPRRVPHTRRP